MTTDTTTQPAGGGGRAVAESLQEYLRGGIGGLLFSLPLLYTMEIWWLGFILSPERLLLGVLGVFGLLLGYNRYAGLRQDASLAEVAIDSVEELGIGLVVAALMLWLLGQIDSSMQAGEIIGKIVIEALIVAIGVSVGTAQLGEGNDDVGLSGDGGGADEQAQSETVVQSDSAGGTRQFGGQLVVSLCGAVLFAANVAPTEEIIMIAFESTPWRLLGLATLSLLLGGVILFYSGFLGAQKSAARESWQSIVRGTAISYAVGLLASAAILWFFGRFDDLTLSTGIAATVVLGMAGSLGASAGRLLLSINQ